MRAFVSLNAEMDALIRAYDWRATPLGPREGWSETLRTAVDMVLWSPRGAILLWGPDLVQVYNDAYRDILGHKHPRGLGQPSRECWPEVWEEVSPIFERVFAGEIVTLEEHHLLLEREGGIEDAWFDLIYTPVTSPDGTVVGILVSVEERTEAIRQAAELRESELRLKVAMAASRAGVFEHQTSGSDGCYLSARWLEILGFEEPPDIGGDFRLWMASRVHSEDRGSWAASRAALEAGETERHEIEMRVRHAEGHWVWVREYAQAQERDEEGHAIRVTGVIVDISKRKQAERDVRRLALHDPLTGLANRHRMVSYLDHEIEAARGTSGMIGLVLADIDGFKKINSAMGHSAGDEVLRTVAFRLTKEVCGAGIAARIGGDEFGIVFRVTKSRDECRESVRQVCEKVVAPFHVEGSTVEVSASFGVAMFPDDGDNAEEMMRHADLALREGKRTPQNIRYFERRMAETSHHRARVETALRRAIEREDFLLHYQPQVCLGNGEIHTVEALVRWYDSNQGLILPGEFISIAETSGAIRPLGAWVLKSAARQQAAWKAAGIDVRVAVNISPAEAGSGEFMRALDEALAMPGVLAGRLGVRDHRGTVDGPGQRPGEDLPRCLHRPRHQSGDRRLREGLFRAELP